jgi:RTX calcium-binding nonapeptide repeat (4 copies)
VKRTSLGHGGLDFLFGQRGNDTRTATTAPTGFGVAPRTTSSTEAAGRTGSGAGGGADQLFGDEGNDRLFAVADDGAVDTLDCGENADDRDRAVLRPGDTAVDCERVRFLGP